MLLFHKLSTSVMYEKKEGAK